MCIVSIVILTETTASLLAIGEIVDTKMDSPRLANGLRADMLSAIALIRFIYAMCFCTKCWLGRYLRCEKSFCGCNRWSNFSGFGFIAYFWSYCRSDSDACSWVERVLFYLVVLLQAGFVHFSKVDYQIQSNLIIVAVSICAGLIPLISPEFFNAFPKYYKPYFTRDYHDLYRSSHAKYLL
jgi:hypothetical protein